MKIFWITIGLLLLAVTAYSTWSMNHRQAIEAARAAELARQMDAEREAGVQRQAEQAKREITDNCLQQAKQGYFSDKGHEGDALTQICSEYIDLAKARAEDAARAKVSKAKRARVEAQIAAQKEGWAQSWKSRGSCEAFNYVWDDKTGCHYGEDVKHEE